MFFLSLLRLVKGHGRPCICPAIAAASQLPSSSNAPNAQHTPFPPLLTTSALISRSMKPLYLESTASDEKENKGTLVLGRTGLCKTLFNIFALISPFAFPLETSYSSV